MTEEGECEEFPPNHFSSKDMKQCVENETVCGPNDKMIEDSCETCPEHYIVNADKDQCLVDPQLVDKYTKLQDQYLQDSIKANKKIVQMMKIINEENQQVIKIKQEYENRMKEERENLV